MEAIGNSCFVGTDEVKHRAGLKDSCLRLEAMVVDPKKVMRGRLLSPSRLLKLATQCCFERFEVINQWRCRDWLPGGGVYPDPHLRLRASLNLI